MTFVPLFVLLISSLICASLPTPPHVISHSLAFSATLEYVFDPAFILPPALATNQPDGRQYTTPEIPHILLPRGLLASLDILGSPLDTYILFEARVGGDEGYTVPGLQYVEKNIPTTYTISLFGETVGGE